jgi:hypothetical protein
MEPDQPLYQLEPNARPSEDYGAVTIFVFVYTRSWHTRGGSQSWPRPSGLGQLRTWGGLLAWLPGINAAAGAATLMPGLARAPSFST